MSEDSAKFATEINHTSPSSPVGEEMRSPRATPSFWDRDTWDSEAEEELRPAAGRNGPIESSTPAGLRFINPIHAAITLRSSPIWRGKT